MMTGLMLVFLLISILTISHVVKRDAERRELLTDFEVAKTDIYEDLKESFASKEDAWGIAITRDLSIKFENPDVLFVSDEASLTPQYKTILDEFVPTYLAIINKPEYADKIKEIRIEGHTADYTARHPTYMSTIELSQDRSNSVLAYILTSESFNALSGEEQEKVRFWLTSNGFGNGRTLDAHNRFTHFSQEAVHAKSRRVEFRIVTTSEELIEKISTNFSS
jgi:outer membrane protein OmpA-like peptidoglycan-associated protein